MFNEFYNDDRPPLLPYFIVSFLLHAFISLLFFSGVTMPNIKDDYVEVIPLLERGDKYEVADISEPAVQKRPDKAKFLGMYDSSADKETVSVSRNKEESLGVDDLDRKNLNSLYDVDDKLFAMRTPDLSSESRTKGDAAAKALEDFYPDYSIGSRTYLNVLRYPEVEYFVRMKKQFKMTFDPAPALRSHFSINRVTQGSIDVVLAVSVAKDGSLSELFILKSSGITTYDQEALRTVGASAPFATPPDKFLEDDGHLRMSWTFTVYL